MRTVFRVLVILGALACLGMFYLDMGGGSSWNEFAHNAGRMRLRNDSGLFLGGFVALSILAFALRAKKPDA